MRTFTLSMIAVLTLGGCAANGNDIDAPDSPIALNDWDGGPAYRALLEGTLELHEGCLMVSRDGDSVVATFPASRTEWNAQTETLTYAGEEFRMGDAISGGGGHLFNIEALDIPPACEPFVANSVFGIMDESIAPN